MEDFDIIQPSHILKPYIKQYWLLKSYCIGHCQGIIPTGYTSLYFHRASPLYSMKENKSQPQAFIAGQSTNYNNLLLTGVVDLICIDFHPFGASTFFTIPLNKFRNSTVSVDDTEDKGLKELAEQILEESNNQTCIHFIEQFLIKRLHSFNDYNYKRILATVNVINTQPQINITSLADISCLSYKQFNRVFTEQVGTSPKEFSRIIRFQRALYTLQLNLKISLTQLALECGYYDQSHLIKEFKSFSGYTPTEYIDTCPPYSDYFSIA